MENRCVCCGSIIPEGRQVCKECEVKAGMNREGYKDPTAEQAFGGLKMRLLPIRVKYFKPGETVAVLYLHHGSNKKPEICERIVEKIGRKYVTDNRGVRYCQEPYLAEWLEESGQVDTEED